MPCSVRFGKKEKRTGLFRGSFSAVSTPVLAAKGPSCRIFRVVQEYLCMIPDVFKFLVFRTFAPFVVVAKFNVISYNVVKFRERRRHRPADRPRTCGTPTDRPRTSLLKFPRTNRESFERKKPKRPSHAEERASKRTDGTEKKIDYDTKQKS